MGTSVGSASRFGSLGPRADQPHAGASWSPMPPSKVDGLGLPKVERPGRRQFSATGPVVQSGCLRTRRYPREVGRRYQTCTTSLSTWTIGVMATIDRWPAIDAWAGTLPEQWLGTTQSPSWVDPPFYETTQHVRPRAAPRDRFLPHRHIGERNERHDEPPCRWHFRLVRVARDRRDRRGRTVRPRVARRDYRRTAGAW